MHLKKIQFLDCISRILNWPTEAREVEIKSWYHRPNICGPTRMTLRIGQKVLIRDYLIAGGNDCEAIVIGFEKVVDGRYLFKDEDSIDIVREDSLEDGYLITTTKPKFIIKQIKE